MERDRNGERSTWHATGKDLAMYVGIAVQGLALIGLLLSGIVLLRQTASNLSTLAVTVHDIQLQQSKLVEDVIRLQEWRSVVGQTMPRGGRP